MKPEIDIGVYVRHKASGKFGCVTEIVTADRIMVQTLDGTFAIWVTSQVKSNHHAKK